MIPPNDDLPQWLAEELRRTEEKVDYLQRLTERIAKQNESAEKPALQTMYEVAQKQIKFLNAQIEDRDRALAVQIAAYKRLEKKLTRLTGLAEDLVQEASEA